MELVFTSKIPLKIKNDLQFELQFWRSPFENHQRHKVINHQPPCISIQERIVMEQVN